jgi:hypothetical protein
VSDADILDAVHAAGAAIGEAVAIFMLHPETFQQSIAAGYPDPFSAYFAGRGGVLGNAAAHTVNAVLVVFEPNMVRIFWDQGVAVHGAEGGAKLYWDQCADFARKYLASAEGLDHLAAIVEKIIATAPDSGLPLFAGWRHMLLADDAPARALQVMFVLRELRAGVHFNALTVSGLSPIEAHMLNKGPEYTAFHGWQEPFADGADKKDRYVAVEEATDRRMAEIIEDALDDGETQELARLSAAALACLNSNVPPAVVPWERLR